MTRLRTFFLREADDCVAALRSALERGPMDRAGLYGAVRQLRGSAQLARFGAIAATARALEKRLRPGSGTEPPNALRREVMRVLMSLEGGIEAVRQGVLEEDPLMEAGMQEQGAAEGTAGGGVVPIETLEYRGGEALERALSLREPLERAIVAEEPAGPLIEELFDLIRLGSG